MKRVYAVGLLLAACSGPARWEHRYYDSQMAMAQTMEQQRTYQVQLHQARTECQQCQERLASVMQENHQLRRELLALGRRLRVQIDRANVLTDINNTLTRENAGLREDLNAERERLRQSQSSLFRLRQMGERDSVPPSVRQDVGRGQISRETCEWAIGQVQRHVQVEARRSRESGQSPGTCVQVLHAAVDIGENLLGFVPAERLVARVALAFLQWVGGTTSVQGIVDRSIRSVCGEPPPRG